MAELLTDEGPGILAPDCSISSLALDIYVHAIRVNVHVEKATWSTDWELDMTSQISLDQPTDLL